MTVWIEICVSRSSEGPLLSSSSIKNWVDVEGALSIELGDVLGVGKLGADSTWQ